MLTELILVAALSAPLGDRGTVTLTEGACSPKVQAHIPPEARPSFKAARVFWDGKWFAACWTDFDGEHYFVVDETGGFGAVPKKLFSNRSI